MIIKKYWFTLSLQLVYTQVYTKNNMKTITDWIETLPENQRRMALHNMTMFPLSTPFTIVNSLQSALLKAFIWGLGNGDIKYWSDVYHGRNNKLF